MERSLRETVWLATLAAASGSVQRGTRAGLVAAAESGGGGGCVVAVLKDKDGTRLIKLLSVPRNPTKGDARLRIRPEDVPDDAMKLYAYCAQDVKAEEAIAAECPELEGEELEFYLCNEEMNARGIQVDTEGLADCIVIVEGVLAKYDAELRELTGGAVGSVNELDALKEWLNKAQLSVDSLDAENIERLLADENVFGNDRRALEIRQAAASSSVKKVYAMRNQMTRAGRLHDLFTYHGARTGRVVGRGPQPTNLPVSGPPVHKCGACKRWYGMAHAVCPWCEVPPPPGKELDEWCAEAAECAMMVIAHRNVEFVEHIFGHALDTVAGCLRGLLIAAPGHELIGSDYNSIEAVVAASVSGEQWRIDLFRARQPLYEMAASKISGVPLEEMLDYEARTDKHHPLRKMGKVAELASPYGGWVPSWVSFGAGEFMTEDQIKDAVIAWRNASPAIVHMWGGQTDRDGNPYMHGMEGAAVSAVLEPGRLFPVARLDDTDSGIGYQMRGDALYCRLPSGRELTYHRPRLEQQERYGKTSWALSFEGYNTNPKVGPKGWVRIRTYGGRLFENVCQATARDILRRAIVTLERSNYPLVMQVYDEVVCEVPEGCGSLEEVERIMGGLPEWCRDWPVRASGGWRGRRFRK